MNYWIWLATVESLGPLKKKALLNRFNTPENIFNAKKEELLEVNVLNNTNIERILASKNIELLKKYEAYILKNNIKIINIIDSEYPEKLRQIYDAPITLFGIGNIGLLNKTSIGIVGTREPSKYGIDTAFYFSEQLSERRNSSC